MKYKVGDKVLVKSIDWYNKNKDKYGDVCFDNTIFVGGQSLYCGCELTIRLVTDDRYYVNENDYYWTDEMIERLVERNGKIYPYKIGDRVVLKGNNRCATITDLKYNSWGNLSYYIKIDNDKDISVDYPTDLLLPYDNMIECKVEDLYQNKKDNMKVDNFDLIKKHINTSGDGSEFYMLQIMRRTKDQKGYEGKHRQSIVKTYFISSPEYLDEKRDEIIGLCEMFNARAYINLNKKSYKQVSLKALEILAGKIAHEDYNIKSLFETAAGQTGACDGQKTWIVDYDSKDLDELGRVRMIIDSIEPKGVSKIVETVPTRHGYHLITRPFNKKAFYEMYNESIDIHDNNPTVIFMNLKNDENE